MRSAKLADVLTRLTIVLAIVAPFVVFGFLYVLLVQPKRAEADAAERRLNTAREELARPRTIRPHREGNILTFEGTRAEAAQFAQTLEKLPAGTTLGSVEMTPSATAADRLRVRAELRDAGAPAPRSESPAVSKPEAPNVRAARPKATEAPAPDPVVSSILVSSGRRVAIVDGQIVRAGDRLAAGVILDIEPDAIVLDGIDGQRRRVELIRPGIGNVR